MARTLRQIVEELDKIAERIGEIEKEMDKHEDYAFDCNWKLLQAAKVVLETATATIS